MNSTDADKHRDVILIPIDDGEKESQKNATEKEKESPEEYIEHLQRLQAEFANYKRRTEREKESLSDYVKGRLITHLLSILDDMDSLIRHHQESHQCSIEEIQFIARKMKKILFDEGLETIDAINQSFNPEIHEAIAVEKVSDPHKEGIILEEWQKGYRFHGSLLRPSRVKVGALKIKDESDV